MAEIQDGYDSEDSFKSNASLHRSDSSIIDLEELDQFLDKDVGNKNYLKSAKNKQFCRNFIKQNDDHKEYLMK